ncbi:hypothetical protein [Nonomuraea sp. NPDC003754]
MIVFTLGVRGSRAFKSIWLALFLGINGISVGWTPLGTWLAQVSHSGATPLVAEHLLTVFTMACLGTWVCFSFVEDAGDPRWRRWVLPAWLVAVSIASILAVLAYAHDLDGAIYAAVGAQQASPAQLSYLALYEGSMMATMYGEVVLFVWRARVAPAHQIWLRRCFYILAITSTFSTMRSVYTMIYLVPQVLGIPPISLPWSQNVSLYINTVPYTVGFLTLLLPKLDLRRSPEHDLAAVSRLWQDLVAVFPHLVRIGTADKPSAELMARSALIGESLVELQKVTPPDLWHRASAIATATTRVREREALAYALWVRSALHHLATHSPQFNHRPTWRLSAKAGTPNWVFAVAHQYNKAAKEPRWWQRRSAAAHLLASTRIAV